MDIMTLICTRKEYIISLAEFFEIMGIIIQCIICMALIDELSHLKLNAKVWIVKLIFLSVNFIIWIYAVKMGALWNILATLLDTIGYFIYLMILKRQHILNLFTIIMATQILNQIGALIVTAIIYGLDCIVQNNFYHTLFLALGYFLRVILLYPFFALNKKYQIDKILKQKRAKFFIIGVGVLFQSSRLIIRMHYGYIDSIFSCIALTTIVMGIIFGILWVIDWYYNEREKRLLWEDNHRMSQRLHKSKEIVPALSVVLEELKSNKESGEFNDILDEIHQLCKEQIEEHEKLAIQNKSFPTTESHVLDERLQLYEIEAVEKNINFDVFVGISMKQILKEKQIKELDVLQIIGDLIRNAFRAIERTKQDGGNILLVMGCVGEVLQIDVYDSGAPFPMFVLNEFGKRGNTEGGTGNGLTDVLELLEKYQATFLLTEYNHGAVYSKGISIIWDHKNQRRFDSARRSQLSKDSSLFSKES